MGDTSACLMSMTDLPTNGKQDKQSANSAIPQPPPITALNANLKQPDDSNTTANTQSVRKRLFLGTENPFGRGTAANNTQEGIKSSYSLPSLSMPPSKIKKDSLITETTKSLWQQIWQEVSSGSKECSEDQIPWWTSRQSYIATFFNVPLKLEQFLFYSLLICIDSFLFIFAILPVRVILALYSALRDMARWRPIHWSASQRFDMARCFLMASSCLLLTTVDGSYLYHFIRGQASLKLYVIFNLIEIFDKLCCSFGQDVFDFLFAALLSRTPSSTSPTLRRRLSVIGALFSAFVYTFLHSFLLFVKVVTLNVSVNAYNNSLLTLLVSNNFVELKGIVFKSFKMENVFQIACSDAVERFQLLTFLSIVCVHNLNDMSWQLSSEVLWNIAYIVVIVAGMEIIVDWLKHAFITRFNKMQSSIFQHFESIIATGVVQQDDIPDSCYTISKRLGFVSLPLACVVFRVFLGIAPISGFLGVLWTTALWASLFTAKILVSLIIMSLSVSILSRAESSSLKSKLATTYAYDKVE